MGHIISHSDTHFWSLLYWRGSTSTPLFFTQTDRGTPLFYNPQSNRRPVRHLRSMGRAGQLGKNTASNQYIYLQTKDPFHQTYAQTPDFLSRSWKARHTHNVPSVSFKASMSLTFSRMLQFVSLLAWLIHPQQGMLIKHITIRLNSSASHSRERGFMQSKINDVFVVPVTAIKW